MHIFGTDFGKILDIIRALIWVGAILYIVKLAMSKQEKSNSNRSTIINGVPVNDKQLELDKQLKEKGLKVITLGKFSKGSQRGVIEDDNPFEI